MKLFRFLLATAALVASLIMSAPLALAQTNAYDDAYHYAYNSSAWYSLYNTPPGINYGFGFTTWAVATNGPASHGFFSTRNGTPLPAISSPTNYSNTDPQQGPTGSPPGNNNSAHVWGIFANGTGINASTMFRGFSNSLDSTVTFKLDWENLGIGGSANNLAGFVLRNGNATNSTSDNFTGLRFAFYYIGGGSNSFAFWDGNGVQHIGIPFTSDPLACEFTLRSDDSYRFVVKRLVTGALLAVLNDQPLYGSGSIDSVALFAQQTSGNQNFNRMQIVSAALTPPLILNLAPVNNALFVDPGPNNVSFQVDSIASTVTGTNVSLWLNGVKQTGLAYSTAGQTTQLFVTNTAPLAANTFYNAMIVAVDSNGNSATNNFSFNTFASNNLSIDAEDYNYDGGSSFLSPTPNAFANLLGVQGIDYYETDLDGTNRAALYRPGDWPQILQVTGDTYDHAGFQAAGATDYELGYTDAGEWHNYTRSLQNTNYIVYARAASGGGGTILLERLANPSATTTDQPKAALGTLIIPATGGSKIYSGRMIPLTDFFSNPVEIRFPGTTTFRETAVNNRAYNLNYLMFVPTTNTGTLRPYLSAGYPYPGALNVALESRISFTIANRQTAVNPASVQVFLNSNNVTGNLSFSNNAAGTVVSFAPATFLAPNVSHSLMVIYGDNDSTPVSITNFWQFTTANSPHTTLPPGDALSTVGSPPGFALRVYKVEDAAPTTASIENAETQLAGLRTNTATGQPYPNLANGGPNGDGRYSEGTVINYDITGTPTGTPAFPYKTAFPYVPPGNPNNNIAMESLMYLHLTAGDHILVVRSDDGFKLTEGPTATNRVLGLFDGGRGNGTPSLIYLTVTQDGFYPMRLLYYQAGSGGNLELYSLNDGSPILVNDPANTASIKAYQIISSPALPVTILNPAHSGNSTTFSFVTQAGRTHYVEYRDSLSSGSWTTMTTINGDGSTAPVVDNTATGDSRFYRVRTE